MNNKTAIVLLLFLAVAGMGCKSKKVATTPLPARSEPVKPSTAELLIRKINSNENTFDYYAARGEADYKDPATKQSFDVAIVMEKSKYIWISITGLLGIEAARMKITADSIVILDRLHHQCYISDYGYLAKFAKADLNLDQLQQIIAGNAVFRNDEKQSIIDTVLSTVVVYTIIGTQKQTAFYTSNLKLSKNILSDRNVNRQLAVEYANPYIQGNNAFPAQLNINIRAEKNVECTFRLNNFAFEKKKEAAFSIPGSYEIIKR
jgi:hypothetical protein